MKNQKEKLRNQSHSSLQQKIKYLEINLPKTLFFGAPKSLQIVIAAMKLKEIISEFRKFAGHKINTQKSLAFLYTNNEKSEREIKQSIPFTIATKRSQ